MPDIYNWVTTNWIEIAAAIVLVEKLVNIIVGWTSSPADDAAWAKVKNVLEWILNLKSNPAPTEEKK